MLNNKYTIVVNGYDTRHLINNISINNIEYIRYQHVGSGSCSNVYLFMQNIQHKNKSSLKQQNNNLNETSILLPEKIVMKYFNQFTCFDDEKNIYKEIVNLVGENNKFFPNTFGFVQMKNKYYMFMEYGYNSTTKEFLFTNYHDVLLFMEKIISMLIKLREKNISFSDLKIQNIVKYGNDRDYRFIDIGSICTPKINNCISTFTAKPGNGFFTYESNKENDYTVLRMLFLQAITKIHNSKDIHDCINNFGYDRNHDNIKCEYVMNNLKKKLEDYDKTFYHKLFEGIIHYESNETRKDLENIKNKYIYIVDLFTLPYYNKAIVNNVFQDIYDKICAVIQETSVIISQLPAYTNEQMTPLYNIEQYTGGTYKKGYIKYKTKYNNLKKLFFKNS